MSEQSQSDKADRSPSGASPVVEGRPRLIGIMRHARVQPADSPDGLTETKLFENEESSAERDLTAIGHALAEVLQGQPESGRVDALAIYHEDTDPAQLTAETLRDAYLQAIRTNVWTNAPTPVLDRSDLNNPSAYASADGTTDWIEKWKEMFRLASNAEPEAEHLMMIYVGHDPAMTWLADHLQTGEKRSFFDRFRPPVPALGHTELLTFQRQGPQPYHAVWSLGPVDDKAATTLTGKVRSKMEAAKVFAGVLTAIATFAANNVRHLDGADRSWALVGLALLGLAVILYLITMFYYDSLLMPRRFWPNERPKSDSRPLIAAEPKWSNRLARPPSSGTVVLYQNMVLVWSRVFIPATFVAGLGLAFYAYGAAELETWTARTVFVLGAIWIAGLSYAIGYWGRPRLGVSD